MVELNEGIVVGIALGVGAVVLAIGFLIHYVCVSSLERELKRMGAWRGNVTTANPAWSPRPNPLGPSSASQSTLGNYYDPNPLPTTYTPNYASSPNVPYMDPSPYPDLQQQLIYQQQQQMQLQQPEQHHQQQAQTLTQIQQQKLRTKQFLLKQAQLQNNAHQQSQPKPQQDEDQFDPFNQNEIHHDQKNRWSKRPTIAALDNAPPGALNLLANLDNRLSHLEDDAGMVIQETEFDKEQAKRKQEEQEQERKRNKAAEDELARIEAEAKAKKDAEEAAADEKRRIEKEQKDEEERLAKEEEEKEKEEAERVAKEIEEEKKRIEVERLAKEEKIREKREQEERQEAERKIREQEAMSQAQREQDMLLGGNLVSRNRFSQPDASKNDRLTKLHEENEAGKPQLMLTKWKVSGSKRNITPGNGL